jgi:hypothetical protein
MVPITALAGADPLRAMYAVRLANVPLLAIMAGLTWALAARWAREGGGADRRRGGAALWRDSGRRELLRARHQRRPDRGARAPRVDTGNAPNASGPDVQKDFSGLGVRRKLGPRVL